MKPCSYQAVHASSLLQNIPIGPVVATVKGSVKKLGQQYKDSTIVLYNKANFQPIAVYETR